MIRNLILKDLRAHKILIFFRILLPMAILGSLFNLQFYPGNVYVVQGCMVIAVAGSVFSFSEKNRNTEILTCSLPVSRVSIVRARYLASGLIMVFGIVLYYLTAYFSTFLFKNAAAEFSGIANLKVLYLSVFLVSIHMAVFLPSVFRFRLLGSIITFAIALVTSVTVTVIIFKPYRRSMHPFFEAQGFRDLFLLSLGIILLLGLSIFLSMALFKKRDL